MPKKFTRPLNIEEIIRAARKCKRCGRCCVSMARAKRVEAKDASDPCPHLTWKNKQGKIIYSCKIHPDKERRSYQICWQDPWYFWNRDIECKSIQELWKRLPELSPEEKQRIENALTADAQLRDYKKQLAHEKAKEKEN